MKNEQRCFGNYEVAFHYDCQICNDKTCKFRKGEGCNGAIIGIGILIVILAIGKLLYELKIWR
mgnify:CR=1 FL=1